MLNVLRLTSGVLKKLQLADLAKLLLISSQSQSSLRNQTERTSTLVCVDSNCTGTPQRFGNHNHEYKTITTLASSSSSTSSSSSSSTTEATSATLSASQHVIIGTAAAAAAATIGTVPGSIDLKTECCSMKSSETVNSTEQCIIRDSSNQEDENKSSLEAMMSSSCASDVSNKAGTGKNSTEGPKSCTSSSQSTSSSSSSEEKSCFTTSLADILKFLELVGSLKHVKRTGWVLRDVKDCESISGHMYRMSMMTFLLDGTEGLNRIKCMELALVHDLAESLVGDITPFCGVSKEDKRNREFKAMHDICKLIEPRGNKIFELFLEYEENESPESKFVKDLDRLDMVLQAFEYEKRDDCVLKHQEFFDSTHGKFSHPFVVKLVNEIYSQRRELANLKNQQKQQNDDQQNGYGTVSSSVADDVDLSQKKASSS